MSCLKIFNQKRFNLFYEYTLYEKIFNFNFHNACTVQGGVIMKITSTEFQDKETVPTKFTCDGENINPTLIIEDVPENTKTLVLIMDDPDVPEEIRQDQMFDHWILFNIPPTTTRIEENTAVGTSGANTRGTNIYVGPCPPPQYQPTTHRYYFKLYALDTELNLQEGATKKEVEAAMQGHVIEETVLMGKYDRS